jgi:hypothetical protein
MERYHHAGQRSGGGHKMSTGEMAVVGVAVLGLGGLAVWLLSSSSSNNPNNNYTPTNPSGGGSSSSSSSGALPSPYDTGTPTTGGYATGLDSSSMPDAGSDPGTSGGPGVGAMRRLGPNGGRSSVQHSVPLTTGALFGTPQTGAISAATQAAAIAMVNGSWTPNGCTVDPVVLRFQVAANADGTSFAAGAETDAGVPGALSANGQYSAIVAQVLNYVYDNVSAVQSAARGRAPPQPTCAFVDTIGLLSGPGRPGMQRNAAGAVPSAWAFPSPRMRLARSWGPEAACQVGAVVYLVDQAGNQYAGVITACHFRAVVSILVTDAPAAGVLATNLRYASVPLAYLSSAPIY